MITNTYMSGGRIGGGGGGGVGMAAPVRRHVRTIRRQRSPTSSRSGTAVCIIAFVFIIFVTLLVFCCNRRTTVVPVTRTITKTTYIRPIRHHSSSEYSFNLRNHYNSI